MLKLGKWVKLHGHSWKVCAIHFRKGERSYMLVDKNRVVYLCPADIAEEEGK